MLRRLVPSELVPSWDRHLEKVSHRRSRRGLPAPQVLVRAPGLEYHSGNRELPFHAASVGKLATATLVMQEVESGGLKLEDPVESLLPEEELAGLFEAPGATLEQLLGHTSGVGDYFEGPTRSGTKFIDVVTAQPDRRWEAQDLLAFTREQQRPVGRPGERFRYSDTGYVLLGRILEERTGLSFHELLRLRVFEPVGMSDSVLWLREPGPERIAPAWLGGAEVSRFESITCDWSGGGIVTTVDDLARLIVALRSGSLLQPGSWEALIEPRHRFRSGIHYGLGTMQLRFEGFMPLLRGLPRPVGHLGVTGVHAFTEPVSGAVVVLNFNGTREMVSSFQTHIRIVQGLARLG